MKSITAHISNLVNQLKTKKGIGHHQITSTQIVLFAANVNTFSLFSLL